MTQLNVFHTWKKCFKFAVLPLTSWSIWEITRKIIPVLTFSFSNLLSKMNSVSRTHGEQRHCWENQRVCPWNRWSEGERETGLGVGRSSRRQRPVSETLALEGDGGGKGSGKRGKCRENAWQAFALSHPQRVVPLGLVWLSPWSRLCKHWCSRPSSRP